MSRRPLSVTIISCIYILTGLIGLARQVMEVRVRLESGSVWIVLVSVIAMICGFYMLRGANWARWLALAWMAFHVIISVVHPLRELVIHAVFMAVLTYFLCRKQAQEDFRGSS
jgi:hypothetical protein